MSTLYMGVGGSWAPHADFVDALMTKRMALRGFKGKRTGKGSYHATPDKEQALDYARDNAESHLKIVNPEIGSIVTWVPGVGDMLLHFEKFAKDLFWERHPCPVLRDAQGSVDIFDTYLSLGRQKRAIGALIDLYLDTITPQEILIEEGTDLFAHLSGHDGEIWITGSLRIEDYLPVPEAETELSP